MPKLLFITEPTDEILYQKGKLEGKVRFPGTDKAVQELSDAGWDVEIVDPTWPNPLNKAKELEPAAALVSTFVAAPRSRDAASMLARMSDVPVYTLGVTQGDDAFRTMAPTVNVLVRVEHMPGPDDELGPRDPDADD